MARIKGTKFRDNLVGTNKRDVITAQGGNDKLKGKAGADVLNGGPGSDIVEGGKGPDALRGGPGADKFKFNLGDGFYNPGTHIGDVVFDYQDLFDKFDIPNTGFLPFGVEGITPYGTGLLVTYFDFIGNPAGNFFVPGYSLAQFTLDDFI